MGSGYSTKLNNVLWRHFLKGDDCWGEGGRVYLIY